MDAPNQNADQQEAVPANAADPARQAETTPPSPGQKKKTIRRVLVIAAVIVVAGGGVWGWHYWTEGRFIQSTDDAFLQADQTAISPKIQGYVEQVYVAANQKVVAGEKLAKIRTQNYQAKVMEAEASLDAAKADLGRAQAEAKRQISDVAQAEAQLDAARTKAAFTQSQVNRNQSLARTGVTTQSQLTDYISQRDQANAQVSVSEAALASAKETINTQNAAVKQAEAAVRQAEAQVATATLDLDATLITAPIAGTIGNKTVTVGQYVSVGTRLMTLVPVEELYLTANFKETQIEFMRVGQPATISVDAIRSDSLHGMVESFAPGTGAQFALIPAENATGNFTKIVQRVPVRIKVEAGPEARKTLLPGLSVTVAVDTRDARQEQKLAQQEAGH